jgi:hypothetical protein
MVELRCVWHIHASRADRRFRTEEVTQGRPSKLHLNLYLCAIASCLGNLLQWRSPPGVEEQSTVVGHTLSAASILVSCRNFAVVPSRDGITLLSEGKRQ